MSGGPWARRAVLRWAVRLFRREWRQQLLLLTLTTVAVTAAVAGTIIVVNAASTVPSGFGDAESRIRLEGDDLESAEATIATVRRQFGEVEVTAHATVPVPGSVQPLDVRDQAPDGPYGSSLLALRHGRYPTGSDEVALTEDAADLFAATIGSTIAFGDERRTVVGVVENPDDLRDDFALVAPGSIPSPSSFVVLAGPRLATPAPGGGGEEPGLRLESYGSDEEAVAATVLAAATLAMALVGLIAAGGFVVVAQRRQRQLGLLAAIGATDRHVRLVMVANGALVGLISAAIGTVLGLVGWMAAATAVESAANHRIDRFDLPWTLIIAVAGLAVLTATGAAWWPARTASRLPVMAALSGRPAQPKPVHRSLAMALVLIVAGVVGIIAGQPTAEKVRPLPLIGGLLGVVLGAVFAAPAAIRLLGAMARRLPFAPRLALRDLARYQARAAAALAAITLGLGIAVAITGVAAANEYRQDEGNLTSNQLLIQLGDPRTSADPTLTDAQRADLDRRAADVAGAIGENSPVPLDVAFNPDAPNDAYRPEPVSLGLPQDAHSVQLVDVPYVATPEVLATYGIDPASIDDGTDLLTAHDGGFVLLDIGKPRQDGWQAAPAQLVDLPPQTSAPRSLITEAAMARHGWVAARAGWIVESSRPLTGAQVKAARAAAADAGLAIEVRSTQDALSTLRTGSTLVGALLAMAIVAMAVGLMRSEATRDLRTLTATGAAARTRRALTASTAAALAVLGVLLGTAGAYVALLAVYHADLGELVPVPLGNLVALGVGLPLAATVAGWAFAGAEPGGIARQALD